MGKTLQAFKNYSELEKGGYKEPQTHVNVARNFTFQLKCVRSIKVVYFSIISCTRVWDVRDVGMDSTDSEKVGTKQRAKITLKVTVFPGQVGASFVKIKSDFILQSICVLLVVRDYTNLQY